MNDQTTLPKPIYVYVLTDPRYPDDVRYVGVTINLKNRLREHIKDAKNKNQNHRTHWISSLLRDGLMPIMTIIDETNNENWVQCEMGWIAYYRSLGCKLVNSTDGGDGGRNPSEETRRKQSESKRGENNYNYGKRQSEESRRKKSEAMRGKIFSEEHRRNMSKAQKNKQPITDETRHRMIESRKIPIIQYTRYGIFIRNWDSIKEAGEELKISPSAITACCKRKPHHRTAGGYMWRYADDPLFLEQPRLL